MNPLGKILLYGGGGLNLYSPCTSADFTPGLVISICLMALLYLLPWR